MTTNSRISSLDGIRAVAISLVLADHSVVSRTTPHSWWLAVGAHAGVLLFFVLSGFLITHLLLQESARTGAFSVPQFYLRRVWRIFPVSFAYLAVVTALYHNQFSWRDSPWLGHSRRPSAWPLSIISRGRSVTCGHSRSKSGTTLYGPCFSLQASTAPATLLGLP